MTRAAGLFHPIVAESFARGAATALVSSLWQGITLASVVALCFHLVPGAPARLRFIVWIVVFAVIAALPLLNASLSGQTSGAAPLSSVPHLQLATAWSSTLAAIWCAAVMYRLIHLALQTVKLRSLFSSAVPVSLKLHPELPLGRAELCISTELDRPSVIGFFSPRILIPAWLFDQLNPGELEQIVLHELEHLRRRDDWMNLLQKIGLVLFPLNPALLWIDRRLAAERELACDDGVLSRTNAPRAYATFLTSLAERSIQHRHHRIMALALGATGAARQSDFSRRIESILGFGRRLSLNPSTARAFAAVLITGVLAGAATLARAPEFVSFVAPAHASAQTSQQTQALALPTPATSSDFRNGIPSARFENAAFHPHPVAEKPTPHSPKQKPRRKLHPIAQAAEIDAFYSESVQRPTRHLMLRASWQQTNQPVLLTLPDGRTFLATYAADGNQPGWLLIQL